jgi:hypothetical protein
MRRRTPPWKAPGAALAFAVLAAAVAHAQPGHRGGGREARPPAPAYAGAYGGRAAPAPAYRGRTYVAPPSGYRGRGYVAPAPAPYEPPPAPEFYQGPNSLGAHWSEQQDEARMGVRQGRIMPLSRVVQSLGRIRPGRVLDAGLETAPDGRAVYRVRWAAAGGRRIDFIVDAETGAVIGRGAE